MKKRKINAYLRAGRLRHGGADPTAARVLGSRLNQVHQMIIETRTMVALKFLASLS
jgi:hypothetical protein